MLDADAFGLVEFLGVHYRLQIFFDLLVDPSLQINLPLAEQWLTPPFLPEQGVFRAWTVVITIEASININVKYFIPDSLILII